MSSLNFREEMCKECNNQASKSAMFAINASFLLNGTAATTLFAKGLFCAAKFCCVGAFVSILCMGLAYLTMLGIAESWKPKDEPRVEYSAFFGFVKVNAVNSEKYRRLCVYLWIASVALFAFGIVFAL